MRECGVCAGNALITIARMPASLTQQQLQRLVPVRLFVFRLDTAFHCPQKLNVLPKTTYGRLTVTHRSGKSRLRGEHVIGSAASGSCCWDYDPSRLTVAKCP